MITLQHETLPIGSFEETSVLVDSDKEGKIATHFGWNPLSVKVTDSEMEELLKNSGGDILIETPDGYQAHLEGVWLSANTNIKSDTAILVFQGALMTENQK